MTKRIKILNVLPLGTVGGAENFVLSLCRHHDNRHFEIIVCILFSEGEVSDQIAAEGYEVLVLNMANGFDFSKAMRLISLIRKKKIDIINIHGQNPLGKLFSILGFPPVIIHTDHGTTMNSPTKRRQRVVRFNRILNPFINHFIAISKGMRQSLKIREKVRENKITLIYNGVDVDTISKTSCNAKDLKKSLNIPSNIPVIGTVGRLVPEKQYLLLLKSFSILQKQGIEFIALIAGDGPEKSAIETLVQKMGLNKQVQLLGQRNDVILLLELMDIFVFSSGGEAFSITLLEAMAKAKPVVAYDVEGVNEAIVTNQTGFLVPFGDVEAFAQKIEYLLELPEVAEQMGQSAYERVCTHFDLKRNINKIEKLYKNLL